MHSIRNTFFFVTCVSCALLFSACSKTHSDGESSSALSSSKRYLSSGTIILSRVMPEASTEVTSAAPSPRFMAPLIGYIPPTENFLPAINETWVEVQRDAQIVNIHQGEKIIRSAPVSGAHELEVGTYAIQGMKSNPIWYAPDTYFQKRGFEVPDTKDFSRLRKGALGQHALFLSPGFAIHSGRVFDAEVGGIRMNPEALREVYSVLTVGATVVVK